MEKKTLGIIHVAAFVAQTMQKHINEILPDVNVLHIADDTLQRDNLAAGVGVIPKHNYFKFTTYARFLQEAGAHVIMLSCSTFNSAVDVARPLITTPLLQIDRPMMDLAVAHGKKIGLLATLPTTVPSSESLLRRAAKSAGKEIDVVTSLQSEAFQVLRQGNTEKHNQMLLEEIDRMSKEVDAIVMAQASMVVLEPHVQSASIPVYNSVRTGLTHARDMLGL